MYLPAPKGGRENAQGCGEDKKEDIGERTQRTRMVEVLFIYLFQLCSSKCLPVSFWGFGNAGLALGSQLKFTAEFRLKNMPVLLGPRMGCQQRVRCLKLGCSVGGCL